MAGRGKEFELAIKIAGKVDKSMGKSFGSVQKMAAASFAAIGGAALAVGKSLYDLGTKFDGAYDAIRVGTGATGDKLGELKDSFKNVYSQVPAEADAAAQAIADYNTRLGLTGKPLEDISKQALQVSQLLGDDLGGVIEGSSKAFQQWGVSGDEMAGKMDYIFKASQSTGAGFTELMGNMQTYGPQLQQLGYGFDESAALMGQMDKAGVNVTEVLGAMKKSVTAMSKEGLNASDGMEKYYKSILGAKTETEAITIASKVFGTRAASSMAAAIRDGAMSADDLTASLSNSSETIGTAAADTYDLTEKWKIFKNGLETKIEPAASVAFDTINGAVEELLPKVFELFDFVAENKEVIGAVAIGIAAGAVAFGIGSAAMAFYSKVAEKSAAKTFTMAGAVTALNLPLLAIVAVVAAVVAGGILLYQNWDLVKAKAVELWTGVCAMTAGIQAAFTQAFPAISAMLGSWWASITGVFENVKGIFFGIIDFIKNVFTGNWEGAWQAVQDIFSNIVGGIVGIFKMPLNAVIGLVNMAIGGINSISVTAPDWVPLIGGQTVGFNIPLIPQLAEGGIATGPTFAEIGEGGEPEAVLPLSKLAAMLEQFTGMSAKPTAIGARIDENVVGTPRSTQNAASADKFVFAPVQHFHGPASRADVEAANAASFEDFKSMMARYARERHRTAFAGG